MDVQSAATQLMSYLGNNPDLVSQFVQHPYSTTAAATGTDERISKADMSQILTQVAAQTTGQSLGSNNVASVASNLLGQNGGSIHALTSALFGGNAASASNASASASGAAGSSMADILAKTAIGAIASRGLASLITSALGTKK